MKANTTQRGSFEMIRPRDEVLVRFFQSPSAVFFFYLYIVNVKLTVLLCQVPQVAQDNNSHYSKIKYARLRDQFSQRKCRSGWLCSSGEHEIALTVCVQFMLSLNPVSN